MNRLRWPFEHEPALTLAVLGVVAVLGSKLLGVEFTGGQLFTAIAALLGVGVSTRQLVRPDARAKTQIRAAYHEGRHDEAGGRALPVSVDAVGDRTIVKAWAPEPPPAAESSEDWAEWPNFPEPRDG